MAANPNYFGFTHGGTQYSAQAATAYPTAQTAYVQPAAQTYAAAAPRAATYDNYGTAATAQTTQYAYARTQPTAATYDASKTYFAPAAAAAAAATPQAATAVYTVADASYNAASKPVYTTTTYTQQPAQRQVGAAKPGSVSTGYVYGTPSIAATHAVTSYANTATPSYTANTRKNNTTSGYDAAVYSAATSFLSQQAGSKSTSAGNWPYRKNPLTTTGGGGTRQSFKAATPSKITQIHYCEVCKISCAGSQTYREHLEGQKHKKKEQANKATPTKHGGANTLRCELCDVACTGTDAYAAHIRGSKHQKVLKLHTRLGKPIPSSNPVVLTTKTTTTATADSAKSTKGVTKTTTTTTTVTKKVVSPKINFVAGAKLASTSLCPKEEKTKTETETEIIETEEKDLEALLLAEKDVVPVGQEYIDEMKNETGKVVSFNCKLCECKFNDPNAKEMHMKGRRHRLQYKKKVDPNLMVDVKPSIRTRKLHDERLRRKVAKEEFLRRQHDMRWRQEMRMEEDAYWHRMPAFGPPGVRRPDTSDDRHVMSKHASIYPTEEELSSVQNIVSACEKSLKQVSDVIVRLDNGETAEDIKKSIANKKNDGKAVDAAQIPSNRSLKGVMRVGVLAKGLLLRGDLNVHLVLLCAEKPTRSMLERVTSLLPQYLQECGEDKFEVKMCVEEAALVVSMEGDQKTTCTITLTSPVVRESEDEKDGESVTVKDPPDVLDRQKCLDALAALRHAKWFQAKASGLPSCVIIIRILRDLCQRNALWTPLSQWAMELLAEKCVSSGGVHMSPGDALRRIFECLSSGILLPIGPGLYDPCEKEPTDAAGLLTNQEREDITCSAQHALRLIAFRQINKVLGMEPLPVPKFAKRFNPRKRRWTNTEPCEEGADGKKDKKDDEAEEEQS